MSEANGSNGNDGSAELALTPAAVFRAMREQGVNQRLLSGRVVRLRTVTPARLLRLGNVPDILTPFLLKSIYQDVSFAEMDEFLAMRERVQDAIELMESLRVVCEAALIHPRIVEEPQAEDEISIDDLTPAEQAFIFKIVLQPAEWLASFRYQPLPDVEALPHQQEQSQPA